MLSPERSSTLASSATSGTSWSWPTSSAVTCAAPASSSTWVNPPVLAPTSRQRLPTTVRPASPNSRRASSSLYAARPTHRSGSSARTIAFVALTGVLGLVAVAPSTRTAPRVTSCRAWARLRTRPRRTSSASRRALPSWGPRWSGSVTAEVGQPVLQRSVRRLAGLGLLVEGPGLGTVVKPRQRRVDLGVSGVGCRLDRGVRNRLLRPLPRLVDTGRHAPLPVAGVAADFLAADFLAADFLAADCLAADFLAVDFLAADFVAAAFFVGTAPDGRAAVVVVFAAFLAG